MKYIDAEKLIDEIERFSATEYGGNTFGDDVANGALDYVLEEIIPSLQQEQQEMNLEKFTQKMNDWKARYNYPDSIPIKATMAFTTRMFYQYPDIARQWYEQLPKAIMDNTREED